MVVDPFQKNFGGVYAGKKVLVIGHTGFKGAWLSLWLSELGAKVTGFSISFPSKPNLFTAVGLGKTVADQRGDVRDAGALEKLFKKVRPDIVFHLAAQPLVRASYQDPKYTFDTNLGGTVNVLECLRTLPGVKAAVIITSDKCYENFGLQRGYHEGDRLGGEDPYSASKACAEIAFKAYVRSFFSAGHGPAVASARAGNVIGGGDWAADRIIPDCVRAWSEGKSAIIRSPEATRPWQHVMEPVSGYLWLGACLLSRGRKYGGDSFNFGPRLRGEKNVGELVDQFLSVWGKGTWTHVPAKGKKEATLLQLSPVKTKKELGWEAALSFRETVEFTARWYKMFYQGEGHMAAFTRQQIRDYVGLAKKRKQPWAKGA